jgi:hypothetical protein
VLDSHRRCDGLANTLTLIEDTDGNIFGGFTLKNPHNVPARRFALNTEEKDGAIVCNSDWGATFGSGCDLCIWNHCQVNNCTFFGSTYANDTGLPGTKVLAGAAHFQVNEIEVFEITD